MKIGVNLSFIIDEHSFGIGTYAINILKGIEALNQLDSYYLIVRKSYYDNAKIQFKNANFIIFEEPKNIKLPKKFTMLGQNLHYDMFQIPKIVKEHNLDLMFYPFNSTQNNMSLKVPIVMTVHDLLHRNFPQNLSKAHLIYVKLRYQALMYRSDYIISISDFVKEDIYKFFKKIRKEKVHTIHNAVVFDETNIEHYEIEKPYILTVNSTRLHKNVITLLKAFNIIKDEISENLVMVVSKEKGFNELVKYIKENDLLSRVTLIDQLSDGQRNYMYKNAKLFVTTSLHEGFGMTPIEAMLSKVPVISTKETSLYEATMGLAEYYEDATNQKELANKIIECLNKDYLKEDLEAKANTLKKAYNYIAIGKKYDDYIKGVLE